jgi:hypothetical protein
MLTFLSSLLLAASFLVLPSCSIMDDAQISDPAAIANAKTVYLIRDNPSNEMGMHLEKALGRRGLKVTSGPAAAKPKNVDLFVEYVDSWKWDITMYLWSLDVMARNNQTGVIAGAGRFHQGFPHTFPNPAQKAQGVVDSIFAARR